MKNEQQTISEAMQLLGKRTSPAKRNAARINAARPRPNRQPKPLNMLPCTCGGHGSDHKATCPRGRAIRRRARQAEENRQDIETAERALSASDPAQWRGLNELKKAVRR